MRNVGLSPIGARKGPEDSSGVPDGCGKARGGLRKGVSGALSGIASNPWSFGDDLHRQSWLESFRLPLLSSLRTNAQPMTSDLTPNSHRVLRLIQKKGIVKGRAIRHEVGISYVDLVAAANQLLLFDLIDAKGEVSNPRRIAFTHFASRPSAERKVKGMLR